jgi:hypothetical protein
MFSVLDNNVITSMQADTVSTGTITQCWRNSNSGTGILVNFERTVLHWINSQWMYSI